MGRFRTGFIEPPATLHDAQWEVCDTRNTARFSAIGFAFGRMLADSLQVPVGLILNAVGGSPTEAWIDRKTLEFEFPDILGLDEERLYPRLGT